MTRSSRMASGLLPLLLTALTGVEATAAADWPTYGGDTQRSQATATDLSLPLSPAWQHVPRHEPQPGWPGPAKNDYWHRRHGLQPRVTYDRAFHVAVVGDRVFFGSSADDRVVCLDADTGREHWSFFTEGPVRLAPAVWKGRVYAGSDDGSVYCLSSDTGDLLWQRRIGPNDRKCIGNGRMISRWPVRSGVLVTDGVAYAAAGLFPTSEGAFLCALNATTGEEIYRRKVSLPCQGYLLASSEHLLIPSGRTAPGLYSRDNGAFVDTVGSPGGCYAVITDAAIVAGAGDGAGELEATEPATRRRLFTFSGRHLIARDDCHFIQSKGKLASLDGRRFLAFARDRTEIEKDLERLKRNPGNREEERRAELNRKLADLSQSMEACWHWRKPCEELDSLILAGTLLFAGGDGQVSAYRVENGECAWSTKVEGRAYGLAAAGEALFVSSDTGQICCFRPAESPPSNPNGVATEAIDAPVDLETVKHEETAKKILTLSGADQGLCLVLGAGDGMLAYQIARHSRLRVIAVSEDAAEAARVRKLLDRLGVYGDRVVVHHVTGASLPYPDYFANLIVSQERLEERRLSADPTEVARVLRPAGGVVCLAGPSGSSRPAFDDWLASRAWQGMDSRAADGGWTLIRRKPLKGAGQWTHGLADPGNTSCSSDDYVKGNLEIQWFGNPGPRPMADRHHRNVVPLAKDGRLFIPGDDQIIVLDAYNGVQLWKREFADSRRLGAFLDCNNMVVDDRALHFVEHDRCHELDLDTGQTLKTHRLPRKDGRPMQHWGYLARVGEVILGTASKPQAHYSEQSRNADLALWYDNMALVTGERLFALDSKSGECLWQHASGLIVHTTLAVGDGCVFFIETHSPKALANELGRVPVGDLQDGPNYLVAIDLATGEQRWKRVLDFADYRHIVYVNYAQQKLLLSGNRYVDGRLWYFFTAIDSATGKDVWKQSHNADFKPGGDHGEQNRHPTIVGDTVYTYPLAYRLHTGEPVAGWRFNRMGHGCGNIAASAHSIFWRGGNPWRMDLAPGSAPQRINNVTRLGCWINAIPAGGLLLVPEASSGCTCAFPLQTSLAYAPAKAHGLDNSIALPAQNTD